MRLSVARRVRPYGLPVAALVAGAVLIGLGLFVALLLPENAGPVICPFRAMTGLPCPTCGLIRSAGLILRGHVGQALAVNPFDTVFMTIVAPVAVAIALLNRFGRVAVRVSLSSLEKRVAWIGLAAVVAANWWYVLLTQR